MERNKCMVRFIVGSVLALVAAGSLLVLSAPASAVALVPAAATEHVLAQDKPPKISQVRTACHAEGASVSLRLGNPNSVELSYQVRLSGGDVQQAQAVTLPAKSAQRVTFDGIPDGEFSIQVLNDLGETVAAAEGVVECPSVVRSVV
jgi:P pilus assembly chaperone PapD